MLSSIADFIGEPFSSTFDDLVGAATENSNENGISKSDGILKLFVESDLTLLDTTIVAECSTKSLGCGVHNICSMMMLFLLGVSEKNHEIPFAARDIYTAVDKSPWMK